MNRLLSTIILGIAAANAALAGPQISWLAESHDFGIFNEDAGEQTCSFTFVNTGDEPLCEKLKQWIIHFLLLEYFHYILKLMLMFHKERCFYFSLKDFLIRK